LQTNVLRVNFEFQEHFEHMTHFGDGWWFRVD